MDTASWLCNVEGVPRDHMPNLVRVAAPVVVAAPPGDEPLVADCALPNATFADSPLDSFLLKVTRDFYAEETPGPAYRSERRGILGLMDEMRVLMFDEAGDAAAQTETTAAASAGDAGGARPGSGVGDADVPRSGAFFVGDLDGDDAPDDGGGTRLTASALARHEQNCALEALGLGDLGLSRSESFFRDEAFPRRRRASA